MDETNIINAVTIVISDASIQTAFNSGLYFAGGVVAVLFGFSFIRLTVGGDKEEL